MKALVFGINGQDGYYLNLLLEKNGIEVIGVSRSNERWILGDVSNRKFVEEVIVQHNPAYIFHLAANSTTRHEALFENHETISTGTLNILEAAFKYSPKSKVFISGSALQFKNTGKPISENDPFEAGSPYSVARIHSVYAARYFRSLGLKTYVGYFFHHDSPRRSEQHLNMKIINSVKRIKHGSEEVIEIGNIEVVKEFNYAGDVTCAIWLLIQQDAVFEAVIGSGRGYAIKEWLRICFGYIGKDWKYYIKASNSYQPGFMSLISDPATIFSLGWRPQVDIEKLAEIMMDESV